MTSGDRGRDWKREHEERRQAEMARGREVVERNEVAQYGVTARDVLSAAFNPDHIPDPNVPNGGVSPETRRRRDEYRNRLSRTNGGQNK